MNLIFLSNNHLSVTLIIYDFYFLFSQLIHEMISYELRVVSYGLPVALRVEIKNLQF